MEMYLGFRVKSRKHYLLKGKTEMLHLERNVMHLTVHVNVYKSVFLSVKTQQNHISLCLKVG